MSRRHYGSEHTHTRMTCSWKNTQSSRWDRAAEKCCICLGWEEQQNIPLLFFFFNKAPTKEDLVQMEHPETPLYYSTDLTMLCQNMMCSGNVNRMHFSVWFPPSFEAPLANMLTECRRAVREQFDAQQQRRAVQVTSSRCPGTPTVGRCPGTPNMARNPVTPTVAHYTGTPAAPPLLLLQPQLRPARFLNHLQKCHLQQQIQQVSFMSLDMRCH